MVGELTHKAVLGWVAASVVAIGGCAIGVGNSIVSRAEAAAAAQVKGAESVAQDAKSAVAAQETRVETRLGRIESKVDQLLLQRGDHAR